MLLFFYFFFGVEKLLPLVYSVPVLTSCLVQALSAGLAVTVRVYTNKCSTCIY